MVPQIARGAPSQQFAFMWQCGHSQRVEMGSKSRPQKSQGTSRTVRRVAVVVLWGVVVLFGWQRMRALLVPPAAPARTIAVTGLCTFLVAVLGAFLVFA